MRYVCIFIRYTGIYTRPLPLNNSLGPLIQDYVHQIPIIIDWVSLTLKNVNRIMIIFVLEAQLYNISYGRC